MYTEQNLLQFCNVDDKFRRLERRSQYMISKLESIYIFPFHVNYLLYLSLFLIISAAMHLTILENNLKCYKWNNHASFFWWSFIGRSWGGANEQSIVSLIITSFVSACMDPNEPPSPSEAMSSLCNCRMENSSKGFVTFHFTRDYASVISKVSQAIGDSRTF